MLAFLPPPLLGSLTLLLAVTSTVFWSIPLALLTIMKLLLPVPSIRLVLGRWLEGVASFWIGSNRSLLRLTPTELDVDLPAQLSPDEWYLVLSNHQSWTDIVVLQVILNRRIPLLKFFLKQELLWVPIIGLGCWALDFPFMKRYSREQREQNPELAERDLQTTRAACARFRERPTTVMNFAEGTRFTPEKHARQDSPYQHLLRPKAGGVALALTTLGERFAGVLDVTICYPGGPPRLWDLLSGRLRRIVLRATVREIPPTLLRGDYSRDPEFRARVQAWVGTLWAEKDALLQGLRCAPLHTASAGD